MKIFRIVFRLIRRGLMWLLLFYWAIFIGYTVMKLIEGGPSRVVAWYRHIGTWVVSGEGPMFVIHELNWSQFFAIQIFYLVVTLALCFFEWRPAKNST